MESSSEPDSPRLEELRQEVQELRGRVFQLEQRIGTNPMETLAPNLAPHPAYPQKSSDAITGTAGAVTVLGRALLGIAGAYLLRAVTEMGTLSWSAGVGLGIAYALAWLVWAARTPAEKKLEVAVHGLTSVLVLAPLLWEAMMRVHVVHPWAAAGVLMLFSTFGLASAWRKDLAVLAWITTLAALVIAAVLLVATRAVIPFTAALLAIAAAVEFSATLDHWLRERWIVAMVTDLAVVLVTYLVTRPGGPPDGYTPISPAEALTVQIALVAIYLASTISRTLYRSHVFTFFETTQIVAAFGITFTGVLRIAANRPLARLSVAVLILLCAIACYFVAFKFLEHRGAQVRNFYAYSTFALLLTVVGMRIVLFSSTAAVCWAGLALAGLWLGDRLRRTTLRFHGAIYLLLAIAVSGLAWKVALTLRLSTAAWGRSAILVGIATIFCYLLVLRSRNPADTWPVRVLATTIAASVVCSAAGAFSFAAIATTRATLGPNVSAATAVTFAVTAISLLLAWLSRKKQRPELLWLVPILMAIGAYNLFTQDLGQQHTLGRFLSLLLYGATLILLPRIGSAKRAAVL
jgi:hypothetical protein